MTTIGMGECFFWYWLTRVVPDKIQRAVKQLCVCACVRACMCKMLTVTTHMKLAPYRWVTLAHCTCMHCQTWAQSRWPYRQETDTVKPSSAEELSAYRSVFLWSHSSPGIPAYIINSSKQGNHRQQASPLMCNSQPVLLVFIAEQNLVRISVMLVVFYRCLKYTWCTTGTWKHDVIHKTGST